jgi:Ca2+:H+ antiporter
LKYLLPLLLLVPITFLLEWTHTGGETAVFVASSLALIPLAGLLGKATEDAAHYTGPRIGSLLNATLGNAAELIITIMALRAGLFAVVKASIAGSIIGNVLVVLGASLLIGGLKHGIQTFDARAAGANATMMILAVVALSIPAVFAHGSPEQTTDPEHIQFISDGMAVVLIVIYVLYVFYTLRATPESHEEPRPGQPGMSLPMAIGLMAASTIGVVFMSEVLVGSIEPVAEAWGLSELFIGVMLVPLVGNVAEHIVAVQMAYQNKMDLSLGIAVGSGLQIALFVTPVLIGVSVLLGTPMTLVFNQYELAALVGASLIAAMISVDGESNWLEGAQLLGLYLMLGIAFFFA